MPNPSPEPDSTHEWFEVYARYPVDLNQLQIGEYVGESELVMLAEVLTSNTCLHLEAGSSVMFSISDQNDLEPDFTTPNLYLNNSDGSLVIAWGGTTLDSVRWETAVDGETLCRTKLALNKPMWMWRPIGVPC